VKTILIVAAALAVAGCGEKPHVGFPTPPADKLVCPDEPGVPDDPVTDAKNAAYLKSMRSWGGACKADVDWLAVWFKALSKK
jgi:hypothetical protein